MMLFNAILLFCSTVFVLTMWFFVRLNRRHAPVLEDVPAPLATPKVSLLIPARNEESNLRQTLPLLLGVQYEALEIIFLDDQSTDGTKDLLSSFQARSQGRIRMIAGSPLPEGWNGKNWACHQLSQAATGEVLIFCDADVFVGSRAIQHTVSKLQHTGAGAVTVVPHQQLKSWAESAVVPLVMQVPTLGFVSLRFAFTSLSTAFTVANGQWLAFRRDVYEGFGGHASAKDAIVEDMVLCKRVKEQGRRVCTALAISQLSVRMYEDFNGVREGFSKNLYGLMQYRLKNFAIILGFFMFAGLLPWIMPLFFGGLWWLPAALLLGARLELASLTGLRYSAVIWHPVGTMIVLGIAIESLVRYSGDRLNWKGRRLVRPNGEEHATQA